MDNAGGQTLAKEGVGVERDMGCLVKGVIARSCQTPCLGDLLLDITIIDLNARNYEIIKHESVV